MRRNQGSPSKNSNQRLDEEIDALFASDNTDERVILKGMKGQASIIPKTKDSKPEGWAVVKDAKDALKKPVDKWKAIEFKLYWDNVLHLQKTKMTLNPGRAYVAKCLRVIRAEFLNQTQEKVSNETIKAYSEWFFLNKYKPVMERRPFTFATLGFGIHIRDYVQRMARSVQTAPVVPTTSPKIKTISSEEIGRKMSISYQGVLLNYGLLISVNYLVAVMNMSLLEAINRTGKTLMSMVRSDKKSWDAVCVATEKHGPYPKPLCFDPELMIVGLETAISGKLKRVKIVEGENDSLSFLKAQ